MFHDFREPSFYDDAYMKHDIVLPGNLLFLSPSRVFFSVGVALAALDLLLPVLARGKLGECVFNVADPKI